jgi:hypothetical protein
VLVSRWDPGEEGHDSVSFGSERDPRWWSGPSAQKWLLVVVALVVGLVIGMQRDVQHQVGGHERRSSPRVDIVSGAVVKTAESRDSGPEFAVQLLNRGNRPVTVTGLAFEKLPGLRLIVDQVVLPRSRWKPVHFSATPDCFTDVAGALSSAQLTVSSAGSETRVTIALPDDGRTLLNYHEALCSPALPPRAGQLIGRWSLEDAYSADSLEGLLLMRFARNGTFTEEPEGVMLLNEERGIEGRYSLRHGRLVIRVTGGYACDVGDRSVWRAGILETGEQSSTSHANPLMSLAWVSGSCPSDRQGMVWLMRRAVA